MLKTYEKSIVFVGTFDTKGKEAKFLKNLIKSHKFNVITIDVGTGGGEEPPFTPDYPREKVAEAAGVTIQYILSLGRERKSAEWIELMAKGASKIAKELYEAKKLDGIISFGGNAGTSLGTLVMKSLPFGVPKVMYSTVASGNTRPYIGTKDICMIPSIADIAGLNRITRLSMTQAAGALMGMINVGIPEKSEKPLIGITEIGRLADNSPRICEILEKSGYEVILFHAVGTGGMALEEMIEQGYIEGVLDISLNEVMDHLHGGFTDAGPKRLEGAAKKGIPAVIAPGYCNRIIYSSRESIPKKFADRDIWMHGISIFVVPVTKDEIRELAVVLAKKINQYMGPAVILLPLKGFSSPKEKFDNPEVNAAFFQELKLNLKPEIEVKELDMHILDKEFADEAAKTFLDLLREFKTNHS
jgi:uncharacterized protein (UPF0261 family)